MCHGGIPRAHIVIGSRVWFRKTLEHNLDLLANLGRIADIGLPVMAGLSRKAMLGTITGRDVDHRQVALGRRRTDRGPERCVGAAGA